MITKKTLEWLTEKIKAGEIVDIEGTHFVRYDSEKTYKEMSITEKIFYKAIDLSDDFLGDYHLIRVKIEDIFFDVDKSGYINVTANIKELDELPEEYNMQNYIHDFNHINLEELCDNEFWHPVNQDKNYILIK